MFRLAPSVPSNQRAASEKRPGSTVPSPRRSSAEDARWYVEHIEDQQPRLNFVIDIRGEACGMIGLVPGEDIQRCSAEVGYWIGKHYWNRGIATRARVPRLVNRVLKAPARDTSVVMHSAISAALPQTARLPTAKPQRPANASRARRAGKQLHGCSAKTVPHPSP
jgi:hypothetical protein